MTHAHARMPPPAVPHFFCGKAGAGRSTFARNVAKARVGLRQLTPERVAPVSSFFEPPQEAEGLHMRVHA